MPDLRLGHSNPKGKFVSFRVFKCENYGWKVWKITFLLSFRSYTDLFRDLKRTEKATSTSHEFMEASRSLLKSVWNIQAKTYATKRSQPQALDAFLCLDHRAKASNSSSSRLVQIQHWMEIPLRWKCILSMEFAALPRSASVRTLFHVVNKFARLDAG